MIIASMREIIVGKVGGNISIRIEELLVLSRIRNSKTLLILNKKRAFLSFNGIIRKFLIVERELIET